MKRIALRLTKTMLDLAVCNGPGSQTFREFFRDKLYHQGGDRFAVMPSDLVFLKHAFHVAAVGSPKKKDCAVAGHAMKRCADAADAYDARVNAPIPISIVLDDLVMLHNVKSGMKPSGAARDRLERHGLIIDGVISNRGALVIDGTPPASLVPWAYITDEENDLVAHFIDRDAISGWCDLLSPVTFSAHRLRLRLRDHPHGVSRTTIDFVNPHDVYLRKYCTLRDGR